MHADDESQVVRGTYARPSKVPVTECGVVVSLRLAEAPRRRRLFSGRGKLRRRYVIRRTIGPNALDAEPIKRGEAGLSSRRWRHAATIEDAGDRLTRGYAKRSFHFPPRGIREDFITPLSLSFREEISALSRTQHTHLDVPLSAGYRAIKSSIMSLVFNRAETKTLYKEIGKDNILRLQLCRRLQSKCLSSLSPSS